MDAKSKANFINSVAGGQEIPCPACGLSNKPGARFCAACGAALTNTSESNNAPAFAPVAEQKTEEQPKAQAKHHPVVHYEEPSNVFAQGLPEWSIEPPQVMVRRH